MSDQDERMRTLEQTIEANFYRQPPDGGPPSLRPELHEEIAALRDQFDHDETVRGEERERIRLELLAEAKAEDRLLRRATLVRLPGSVLRDFARRLEAP